MSSFCVSCPMLLVSLVCSFLIVPSVFSKVIYTIFSYTIYDCLNMVMSWRHVASYVRFIIFLKCPINEHIRNTVLILQIYGAIDIDIILYWKRKLNCSTEYWYIYSISSIHNVIVIGVTFTDSFFFLLCKIYFVFFCKRLISLIHCSNIDIFCHVLCYVLNCRERTFIMLLWFVPNPIVYIIAIIYV